MTYSASPGAVVACARCGSERLRVVEGDFEQARSTGRVLGPGDHALFVHHGPPEAAPRCARFLIEGVDRGERVLAAVPEELRQAVAAELPAEISRAIEWAEPSVLYADFDAERVASTYEGLLVEEPRTTRILAGLDRGCAEDVDPEELSRYETIAHAIITRRGASVLCVYNAEALPVELVDVGALRHGLVVHEGSVRRNERFEYQPV